MREPGTSIGSSKVIGIERKILLRHEKSSLDEFDGPMTLNKDWCFMENAVHKKSQFKIKDFTFKL